MVSEEYTKKLHHTLPHVGHTGSLTQIAGTASCLSCCFFSHSPQSIIKQHPETSFLQADMNYLSFQTPLSHSESSLESIMSSSQHTCLPPLSIWFLLSLLSSLITPLLLSSAAFCPLSPQQMCLSPQDVLPLPGLCFCSCLHLDITYLVRSSMTRFIHLLQVCSHVTYTMASFLSASFENNIALHL